MSHLTIVPEYLNVLLNGRLQKAKSVKERHQNRIIVQIYLDPSNSTVKGPENTGNTMVQI